MPRSRKAINAATASARGTSRRAAAARSKIAVTSSRDNPSARRCGREFNNASITAPFGGELPEVSALHGAISGTQTANVVAVTAEAQKQVIQIGILYLQVLHQLQELDQQLAYGNRKRLTFLLLL